MRARQEVPGVTAEGISAPMRMVHPRRAVQPFTLVVAGGLGVLLASTLWLWARHGLAVFHEMIVAGLALCF